MPSAVPPLLAVRSVEHIFTNGLILDEDIMFTSIVLEEHFISLTVDLMSCREETVWIFVLVVDLLHLGPELEALLIQLTERRLRRNIRCSHN